MKESIPFFVTCPKGLERLLEKEIADLGGRGIRQTVAGVGLRGDLETAYRICLWSRLANRVLMPLASFRADTPDELYESVSLLVHWDDHVQKDGSFAVDFSQAGSNRFHSHYAALRIKDAVVDQFRGCFGVRPAIDKRTPDIRINVHMRRSRGTISLDLSGESLHKRGYRMEHGVAPIKENLAAAVLMSSRWPGLYQERAPLVDPMCGSGTLLIEGALMARDQAPGLMRPYYGFLGWKGHDRLLWKRLREEATNRAAVGARRCGSVFFGFDVDASAVQEARANARKADLAAVMHLDCRDIRSLVSPGCRETGLVIVNPPYGERMGAQEGLVSTYRELGKRLKADFTNWRAAVFTGNPDLAKLMGIRAAKYYKFYNGTIPCRLLIFEIGGQYF